MADELRSIAEKIKSADNNPSRIDAVYLEETADWLDDIAEGFLWRVRA